MTPRKDLVMQFCTRPAIETGKAMHEQTGYRKRHNQGDWSIIIPVPIATLGEYVRNPPAWQSEKSPHAASLRHLPAPTAPSI
jgi:hypothetical protein